MVETTDRAPDSEVWEFANPLQPAHFQLFVFIATDSLLSLQDAFRLQGKAT